MTKRSKRPKGKSKFTVKETKLSTMFGSALGFISLITVILLLYLTFIRGGEATISYGFAGILASIFSVLFYYKINVFHYTLSYFIKV